MTKNRNAQFQSLILQKNNDKKLVGVEHANEIEKQKPKTISTSKAKKLKHFIVSS